MFIIIIIPTSKKDTCNFQITSIIFNWFDSNFKVYLNYDLFFRTN